MNAAHLEKLNDGQRAAVIHGIGLPDGQGLELMEPFVALAKPRTVAGIALSGYGMAEDLQRSQSAGFAYHLTKPVDPDALRSILARTAEPAG